MEEIKKQIEEEAERHASSVPSYMKSVNNYTHEQAYADCVQHGANFILSKWQDSERWRKVEEELPPLGEPVWLKDENAERNYSKYDSGVRREYDTQDGWYWDNTKSTRNYTHWRPIH